MNLCEANALKLSQIAHFLCTKKKLNWNEFIWMIYLFNEWKLNANWIIYFFVTENKSTPSYTHVNKVIFYFAYECHNYVYIYIHCHALWIRSKCKKVLWKDFLTIFHEMNENTWNRCSEIKIIECVLIICALVIKTYKCYSFVFFPSKIHSHELII